MMADLIMYTEDENSSIDKLEVTRNPFDSNLFDKENFPVLDSSIFTETEIKRKSSGEFRWSIDQLSKLKPTEMDLCPNQEYSVTYEKKEDEERDQQQVNEYFKNVLLPSPWLENRADILKRVTFSPLPPSTKYIQHQDERTSLDLGGSPVQLLKDYVSKSDANDETMLSDACCQTMLTIPMNLDLESIIGKQFFTYIENDNEAKELMISSLRRKLFGQDNTPVKKTKSHFSVSPGYTTSSPTKENSDMESRSSRSPSLDQSPSLSPVRSYSSGSLTPSVFSTDNELSPFKQASNVGTPQHGRVNISFSPVANASITSHCVAMESDCSFLPGVSFDFDDTEEGCVRESSRAVTFHSPDISPIKLIRNKSNPASDSIDDFGIQSIKESTARNVHTIFDISSINDELTNTELHEVDDRGPLDISELTNEDATLPSNDDIQKSTGSNNSYKSSTSESATSQHFPEVEKTGDNAMPDNLSVTPLKSILKKRDLLTPTRANLKDIEREQNTRYNTQCNSGRRNILSKPAFTRIATNQTPEANRPRPILDNVQNRENNEPDFLEWRAKQLNNETVLSSDQIICLHANSVLNRAKSVSCSSIDIDFDDKENSSPMNRRYAQLNSTEVTNSINSPHSEKNVTNNIQVDSGVGSMEFINQNTKIKYYSNMVRSRSSISPLLPFDRLSLHSGSPWNTKIKSTHQRFNNYANRSKYKYLSCRSRSWPDQATYSMVGSPMTHIPQSRVQPRHVLRHNKPFSNKHSTGFDTVNSITNAYKDLLASPLK